MFEDRSVDTIQDYLERLASAAPTPGGGSAAGYAGAMSAALVAMVARVTLANPVHAKLAPQAAALADAADRLRTRFLRAREDDERAYAAVIAALALPRADDEQKRRRSQRLQGAYAVATAAPLEAAALACEAFELTARARDLENRNLAGDVVAAAAFARTALEINAANVRSNHPYMKDTALVETQRAQLVRIERAASDLAARVTATVP